MKKSFCDRCGKEINYEPTTNASFPRYSIFIQRQLGDLTGLDICPTCTESFKQWLQMEEINGLYSK